MTARGEKNNGLANDATKKEEIICCTAQLLLQLFLEEL